MVVAIAVTGMLAVCLSAMLVPITNLYSGNSLKVELVNAATARLNDIAAELRGATHVYLHTRSDGGASFPDPSIEGNKFANMKRNNVRYGIALSKQHDMDHNGAADSEEYLFPEMKVLEKAALDMYNAPGAKSAEVQAAYLHFPSHRNIKEDYWDSDSYLNPSIYCADPKDFYFVIVKNNTKSPRTSLEIHLKLKSGNVSYEGVKTITCDNLVTLSSLEGELRSINLISSLSISINLNELAGKDAWNTYYRNTLFSCTKKNGTTNEFFKQYSNIGAEIPAPETVSEWKDTYDKLNTTITYDDLKKMLTKEQAGEQFSAPKDGKNAGKIRYYSVWYSKRI